MAESLVYNNANTSLFSIGGLFGPFWVDEDTGYIVLIDTDADIAVYKTTNGSDSSPSWAEMDSADRPQGTSISGFAAWWDLNTPGRSGSIIHVAQYETNFTSFGNLYYAAFDTSTDQWSSRVSVKSGAQPSGTGSCVGITVTVGGLISIGLSTNVDGTEGFYTSSDGSSWTRQTALEITPTSLGEGFLNDIFRLFPVDHASLSDDAVIAIFVDNSATALSYKVYDPTSSPKSWSETALATLTSISSTHLYGAFGASIRHSDGKILVAAFSHFDNAAGDLLTWEIDPNSGATAKTNVITNSDDVYYPDVFVDQQTDDVYVAYLGAEGGSETLENVVRPYYKRSQDGMSTWGSQTADFGITQDDYRVLSSGLGVGDTGGRYMLAWFDDDDNDVFIAPALDVEIPAVAGGDDIESVLGTASISTNRFAPNVIVSDHKSVVPTTRSVATATFAPSVSVPRLVVPVIGELVTDQLGIDVNVTENQLVRLGYAELVTELFEPSVTTPVGIEVEVLEAELASQTPTVSAPRTVEIGSAELEVDLSEPVAVLGTVSVPEAGDLAVELFEPTVTTPRVVVTGPGELVTERFEPAITVGIRSVPGLGELSTSRFAPVIVTPVMIVPELLELELAGFDPTIITGAYAIIGRLDIELGGISAVVNLNHVQVPTAGELAISGSTAVVTTPVLTVPATAELVSELFDPTVTLTANQLVRPGVASMITTRLEPAISVPRLVVVDPAELVIELFVPSAGSPVEVKPGTGSLISNRFAPLAVTPRVAVIETGELISERFAPIVSTPRLLIPAAAGLAVELFDPLVAATQHVNVVPAAGSFVTSLLQPTVVVPVEIEVGAGELVSARFASVISTPIMVVPAAGELLVVRFDPSVVATSEFVAKAVWAAMIKLDPNGISWRQRIAWVQAVEGSAWQERIRYREGSAAWQARARMQE